MDSRKKVMLVAKSLEQGGIEVMIRETAKELRKQGHDVAVFTFGQKGQHIGDLIEMDGTPIIYGGVDALSLAKTAKHLGVEESTLLGDENYSHHVQSLIRKDLSQQGDAEPYLAALSQAAQEERPDGIISFHAKTHILLDKLKGTATEHQVSSFFNGDAQEKPYSPLPVTTQLSFCVGGLDQEKYLLEPEHALFHNALRRNRTIYCGQTVHDAYVEKLFPQASLHNAELAKKHRAIPNGIDCSRFAFNAKARQKTRNLLGIAQDAKVIIFPARYSFQKDVPTFVEAMQQITRENPAVHIIMCGRDMDAENPALQHLANNPQFHLMGERKRLNSLYSASDIYANTSHFEGLSIAMLEAMAYGNHPVVTPAGDAEIVTEGIGTLIPFSGYSSAQQPTKDKASVEDTVKAFRHALSFVTDRATPSERVKERYSLAAMVQGYTDFLFNRQPVLGRS